MPTTMAHITKTHPVATAITITITTTTTIIIIIITTMGKRKKKSELMCEKTIFDRCTQQVRTLFRGNGYDQAYSAYYNQSQSGNNQGVTGPYEAFNISQCDSYSGLWTWDLAISCGNRTSGKNCSCTFAEQLMKKGSLSCSDRCPSGCSICSTCLQLSGCSNVRAAGSISAQSSTAGSFLAATALVFFISLCCCCACKRSRNRRDIKGLGKRLMEEEDKSDGAESPSENMNVWMAPVNSDEIDENGNHVWLVPDDLFEDSPTIKAEDNGTAPNRKQTNEKKVNQKRLLNNHTNAMENFIRHLQPRSDGERNLMKMSGLIRILILKTSAVITALLVRFRREWTKLSKGTQEHDGMEPRHEESSISTHDLHPVSSYFFPDIMANFSTDNEIDMSSVSTSEQDEEKDCQMLAKTADKRSSPGLNQGRQFNVKQTRSSSKKNARAKRKLVHEEISSDSDTSRSLFPDLLAPDFEVRQKMTGAKIISPRIESSKANPPTDDASVDSSALGSNEGATSEADYSSITDDESVRRVSQAVAEKVTPKLVNGLWLIPMEGDGVVAAKNPLDIESSTEGCSNDDDEVSLNSLKSERVAEMNEAARGGILVDHEAEEGKESANDDKVQKEAQDDQEVDDEAEAEAEEEKEMEAKWDDEADNAAQTDEATDSDAQGDEKTNDTARDDEEAQDTADDGGAVVEDTSKSLKRALSEVNMGETKATETFGGNIHISKTEQETQNVPAEDDSTDSDTSNDSLTESCAVVMIERISI